ncbi:hypothetical protein M422DRAFT_28500 [Sphaerobolus stellatus SS14]|nr:hypothetical protein M422DRAFT_28500 [Sphaerobolus stellatus SS14]
MFLLPMLFATLILTFLNGYFGLVALSLRSEFSHNWSSPAESPLDPLWWRKQAVMVATIGDTYVWAAVIFGLETLIGCGLALHAGLRDSINIITIGGFIATSLPLLVLCVFQLMYYPSLQHCVSVLRTNHLNQYADASQSLAFFTVAVPCQLLLFIVCVFALLVRKVCITNRGASLAERELVQLGAVTEGASGTRQKGADACFGLHGDEVREI